MTTKILILTIGILLNTSVFGQSLTEKGNWVFGMNPVRFSIFNTTNHSTYAADTLRSTSITMKRSNFGIGLNNGITGLGYFVLDNVSIGVGFGSLGLTNNSPLLSPFLPGLSVRYYLIKNNNYLSCFHNNNGVRYAFFIQGNLLGMYALDNGQKEKIITSSQTIHNNSIITRNEYIYGGTIEIGFTYVLTKHLAIELLSMYAGSKYVRNTSGGTIDRGGTPTTIPPSNSVSINHNLSLLLGMQFYFQ